MRAPIQRGVSGSRNNDENNKNNRKFGDSILICQELFPYNARTWAGKPKQMILKCHLSWTHLGWNVQKRSITYLFWTHLGGLKKGRERKRLSFNWRGRGGAGDISYKSSLPSWKCRFWLLASTIVGAHRNFTQQNHYYCGGTLQLHKFGLRQKFLAHRLLEIRQFDCLMLSDSNGYLFCPAL